MPRAHWENTVVELFTETSILGRLIGTRIDAQSPAGLNECTLAVLMILGRQETLGSLRQTVIWTLEDQHNDVRDQIDDLTGSGLIHCDDADMLFLTKGGRAAKDDAIRLLIPQFEPALQGVSVDALEHAMVTLREIRRTLDNLPD